MLTHISLTSMDGSPSRARVVDGITRRSGLLRGHGGMAMDQQMGGERPRIANPDQGVLINLRGVLIKMNSTVNLLAQDLLRTPFTVHTPALRGRKPALRGRKPALLVRAVGTTCRIDSMAIRIDPVILVDQDGTAAARLAVQTWAVGYGIL